MDALGPGRRNRADPRYRPQRAANKIAVAFNADDPQVETGVEYYDIDVSTGELRYDVSPATPSA